MGDPGFEDDESTVMIPSFSEGSFFADRYRVEKLLGSGAMGRVYAATELHNGRRCAIKVLHKERLGEEETVARFRREANVLASIGHPCIVEIFAFHHTPDGSPYLAMELLEGVTLKTRLRNAGRFEDPRAFQPILDGVCGALDAAHEHGVVHRDLKPDNLFLPATGEPRVKLVDFGLSRIAAPDKDLTHSGMILGTPRYMAPEQIRDASSAGPGGDIYSLAVVVYEALSGQSPYPAQDYGQLLGCVLEARTTPLAQVRPELGQALSDVLARAMTPEASARFQTCGAFANAFGHAIGSPSRVAEITSSPRDSGERPKRSRVPSLSNVPVNKGSTLAFDASAVFGGSLPDPSEIAPGWEENEATSPSSGQTAAVEPSGARPVAPDTRATAPQPIPPHLASPAPAQPSAPMSGSAPPQAFASPPANLPSAPAFGSAPPGAHGGSGGPAPQGGDTLYLGNVGEVAPPAPAASPFGAAPGSNPGHASLPGHASHSGHASIPGHPVAGYAPSGPSHQATPYGHGAASGHASFVGTSPAPVASYAPPSVAAPPPKKSRWGIVLFFLAMVVVIVVSAAAGLGLRAHMRGELDLPFEIPGVTPADDPADDAAEDASGEATSDDPEAPATDG